jgi:hypothetical protein
VKGFINLKWRRTKNMRKGVIIMDWRVRKVIKKERLMINSFDINFIFNQ